MQGTTLGFKPCFSKNAYSVFDAGSYIRQLIKSLDGQNKIMLYQSL